MLKKNKCSQPSSGFTIVELLMASAVFAIVLLVALTGFLQIGRIFYKGVSASQTQDVSRQVLNSIVSDIKTSSADSSVQRQTASSSGGYEYLCAGGYRYTYGFYKNPGTSLNGRPIFYNATSGLNYDPGSSAASFGLLKDKLPGEGTCPEPCVVNNSPSQFGKCPAKDYLALDTNSPVEVLGNGMRVGNITLAPASATGLYNLAVIIAYGDDTALAYDSSGLPYCQGNSSDQKFCAVEQLSTTVFRGGLHP